MRTHSLELINREPRHRNITFDCWNLDGPRNPGSLKRRTAPIPIKVEWGRPLDFTKQLGVSYEKAKEILAQSPQAQTYLKKGYLTERTVQRHVANQTKEVTPEKPEPPKPTPQPKKTEGAEVKVGFPAPAEAKAVIEAEASKVEEPEAPEAEKPSSDALRDMSKDQLIEMAKELDIPMQRGMKLGTLRRKIKEALE